VNDPVHNPISHPGNQPLVSIIVPLYNHARYIEATLESFANEGHLNLEVVIIDDGSKDDSFQVAQAWLERHPNVFTNVSLERQENAGITKTLNRLLARANGEFITMVASDDLLLPGGIQARLAALERRPDWLAVFGDASVIDADGQETASSALRKLNRANTKALVHDRFRTQELILRWSVPGPVLLARRQTYDPIHGLGGFNESRFLEDRFFYLQLLARKALGFVEHRVAAYRMHGKNTINRPDMQSLMWNDTFASESELIDQFMGKDRQALEFVAARSAVYRDSLDPKNTHRWLDSVRLLGQNIQLEWKKYRHDLVFRRSQQ
jgi:glycosyltransferase involved in cell wall biosynthesis